MGLDSCHHLPHLNEKTVQRIKMPIVTRSRTRQLKRDRNEFEKLDNLENPQPKQKKRKTIDDDDVCTIAKETTTTLVISKDKKKKSRKTKSDDDDYNPDAEQEPT